MKEKNIKLSEWFDIHDLDHLRALAYFNNNDEIWPEKFIPDNVLIDIWWKYLIFEKMAHAWISDRLK